MENKYKNFRPARQESEPEREDILAGKNPVYEAVKSGREIDKILFASGSLGSVGHIVALARKKGITAQETDKRKLDKFCKDNHQGIIAFCAAAEYRTIDDMLALAAERNEAPLIVLCDGITDPHNLGAIIRTAEIAGAHGVIIPKRRSAGLNAACAKAAAGALEHLPVAKCTSSVSAIEELKSKGLFAWAAAGEAKNDMYHSDMVGPTLIVIGSEGDGVSRLAAEKCDGMISIPQKGHIQSLNASNAAAIILYEVFRQRMVTCEKAEASRI